jgi:hypothetical protein
MLNSIANKIGTPTTKRGIGRGLLNLILGKK